MKRLCVDLIVNLPTGPWVIGLVRLPVKDGIAGQLIGFTDGDYVSPVNLRLPVRVKFGPLAVNQTIALESRVSLRIEAGNESS